MKKGKNKIDAFHAPVGVSLLGPGNFIPEELVVQKPYKIGVKGKKCSVDQFIIEVNELMSLKATHILTSPLQKLRKQGKT